MSGGEGRGGGIGATTSHRGAAIREVGPLVLT